MNALPERATRPIPVLDDPRWRRWILALALAYFLAQFGIAAAYQWQSYGDATIFGAFWEAGRHLDYANHPLVPISDKGLLEINLNPPAILPLFQLFALFDPYAAQMAWMLASGVLFLACAWALRDAATIQLVWLLTFPIAFTGITLGQIYVALFALGVAAYAQFRAGRPAAAAAILGLLVAFKPNFALWGIVAFAAGYRREAIVAGLVACALSLVPVLLYGPDIYVQWLRAVAADAHYLYAHDISVGGTMRRFGIAGAGVVILAGIAAVTVWAWRVRPTLYDLTPVALVAALLFSPLAWQGYVLVTLGFMLDRPWRLPMLAATFLMYLGPIAWDARIQDNMPLAMLFYWTPVLVFAATFVARAHHNARRLPVRMGRLAAEGVAA